MNAERLHAVALVLSQELSTRDSVGEMQGMITALQRVVNQPVPQHQQNLANALRATYTAVTDTPTDAFSPAWRQLLQEIGAGDLFGNSLKRQIEEIFSRNQITPAVALEELQQLHQRLQEFKTAVDQLLASYHYLKIGSEKLSPGQCEIGMLIPRTAVENGLAEFGGELKELSFILNTLSEVSTGQKAELSIRTLSSSDFLVYLDAVPPFAACLAVAIERIVALYKQLLEIRKLRSELLEQGVPPEQMSGIEKHANDLMDKGVEKLSNEIVIQFYTGKDKGRKHELINAARISLNRIANRIDHGYNIEVRAEKPQPAQENGESEAIAQQIQTIQAASKNMQFMKLEGKPILQLPEGADKTKGKKGDAPATA